jgi:4-amino-4-deoxy-L-arabinose transferase-like glycosyltransferase
VAVEARALRRFLKSMADQEAERPSATDDARRWRAAILITFAALVVRLVFAALLPLFPDETYYWDWSRHPASGYFDHPPTIAILIRWGTSLAALFGGGPSSLAVRFFPVIAGGIATLFAVWIARRLGGGAAARTAAWAFSLMPLAATGLVLATPDAPLLAASAAGLYCVIATIQAQRRSREATQYWCAAGVALGIAFSSKYTSILLPFTVTAAVLARPSLRARLREPGPYLACILATLVFLPVLYWNAKHDWISFRFQIEHGLGAPRGSAIKRELDLIGGQLGLVSPILFVLAAHAVWRTVRRPSDDARFTLAIVAVGSWVFFAYSAMRRSVEPNWPAPSYIPGLALLAALASTPARDRWIRRGIALAAVLIAVIYVHSLVPILPIPARRDPVARSAGWDGLAASVEQARVAMGPGTFAGAGRYQDVSELAYHLPGRPQTFCACSGGRRNQYDLWPNFSEVAKPGANLVLALDESSDVHYAAKTLAPYFSSVTRGALVAQLRGSDTVSVRRIWVLSGYRGGWPSR